jgi:hypothetical protein
MRPDQHSVGQKGCRPASPCRGSNPPCRYNRRPKCRQPIDRILDQKPQFTPQTRSPGSVDQTIARIALLMLLLSVPLETTTNCFAVNQPRNDGNKRMLRRRAPRVFGSFHVGESVRNSALFSTMHKTLSRMRYGAGSANFFDRIGRALRTLHSGDDNIRNMVNLVGLISSPRNYSISKDQTNVFDTSVRPRFSTIVIRTNGRSKVCGFQASLG